MPRDREKVRRRLMEAAMELYALHGYEQTTAAEIAAKAGVTERTFFRHFADKREMFFGAETVLEDKLTDAVAHASPQFGAWETLFFAFRSVAPLFVENRYLSEPGRSIVAGSSALQERQAAKVNTLSRALAAALVERGLPASKASLVGNIGVATLRHAVSLWLDDGSRSLDEYLIQAFADVRDISAFDVGAPAR